MKDELIKYNIEIEIIGDINITVNIIVNEFKHVLLNLITNAKDAFNERETKNKKIIIETQKYDNRIELSVEDNAGGIPKEYIDKIFIPNFTTKSHNDGTGIGLHISRIILEKINATISVENVNDGARFTITIQL
jgi:C4-dicarboxylate-specific signal transduction histidine kinase